MSIPSRGEIWLIDLDPTYGQGEPDRRPFLILSDDRFNRSRAGLVFAVPLTMRDQGLPTHVPVFPPEDGVPTPSFVRCEDLRPISTTRLIEGPWGRVSARTLGAVEDRVRLLLKL